MLSLFRRVVVSAFLTAFPAMSQDVAAPSMANVDLETEEGKALERYQQAIDRVEMLGCVLNDDKAGDERPGDTGNRGRHDCSHELCAASPDAGVVPA